MSETQIIREPARPVAVICVREKSEGMLSDYYFYKINTEAIGKGALIGTLELDGTFRPVQGAREVPDEVLYSALAELRALTGNEVDPWYAGLSTEELVAGILTRTRPELDLSPVPWEKNLLAQIPSASPVALASEMGALVALMGQLRSPERVMLVKFAQRRGNTLSIINRAFHAAIFHTLPQ